MATNQTGRAGTYVKQPTGYKAFIPKSLPPDPKIDIDDETWALVSRADRALARLDMTSEILPDLDLFVYMYVRKEALLSSQIEGTQASLMDVLEFEVKSRETGRHLDAAVVVNYIDAMNHGLGRLAKLPVSLRLIREIHARLLKGVRGRSMSPGEFRRSQNWIGPQNCSIANASFVPPPPADMMDALSDLEKFIHDDRPMPVLIKLGIVHAQFETIHPFLDGNGRVGRLLITFLLCENRILKKPLLYLSYFFKKLRTEYYDRLQAVRDRGDWQGWLRFFLRGVAEVSEEATNIACRIMRLREAHRELVIKKMGKGATAALKLLESLYQDPYVSVSTIADASGLTISSANVLANRLCLLGILEEYTGQKRNRFFVYADYLALFEDEEDEEAGDDD
jgi:Fic family protein